MTPEMKNAGRYGIPEQDPGADVGGLIAVDRAIDALLLAVLNSTLTDGQRARLRRIVEA